jgi:hypothetical protein
VRPEGLRKLKKFIHFIGSRIRDLPVFKHIVLSTTLPLDATNQPTARNKFLLEDVSCTASQDIPEINKKKNSMV